MSARINLLPEEIERRERARRSRALLALAGVGFLLLLGGLYWIQVNRVNEAQERLQQAEEEQARLQAEANRLQEFAQLGDRLDEANEVLRTAMSAEASLAGILQDVAAVMPSDAALTSLAVNFDVDTTEDVEVESFGRVTGQGDTLEGHAPGVERFLLSFEKIAAFFNVYFSNSTVDDEGITVFTFEFDLGPEVLTGRYVDGLPEALE